MSPGYTLFALSFFTLTLPSANVFCYCRWFVRSVISERGWLKNKCSTPEKKITGRVTGGSVFSGNIPAKPGQHVGGSVGDLDPDPNMHASATFWQAVSGSTSERIAESGSTSKSKTRIRIWIWICTKVKSGGGGEAEGSKME
jgi:hypothetical protein